MRNKKDTNDTESIYNFHEESTADQAMAIWWKLPTRYRLPSDEIPDGTKISLVPPFNLIMAVS
jgi:hypothetical protein